MQKPTLIDAIANKPDGYNHATANFNGRWFIAKPLRYRTFGNLPLRLYHAWLVLRDKAFAVQYYEDWKD